MLFLYGSSGKNRGLFFQVSSIYSRIMSDSTSGFPLTTSTGTFLWTGLYLSSTKLLFTKSSSTYSYYIPLISTVSFTSLTKGLAHIPCSLTLFSSAISVCDTEIWIAMEASCIRSCLSVVTFPKPALVNFLQKYKQIKKSQCFVIDYVGPVAAPHGVQNQGVLVIFFLFFFFFYI